MLMTTHQGAKMTVEAINQFLADQFFNNGSRCTEVGPTFAVSTLHASEANLRPGNIVSGPSLFSLCDSALYLAVFGAIGFEPMALTSELSIRFMRPAIGTDVVARADLDHIGGRSIIGTVRVWMAGAPERIVAVAQGTYVRPRK
jgi:uncharacterized protein (TIGR00369 family)